jgi:hypothetical protein
LWFVRGMEIVNKIFLFRTRSHEVRRVFKSCSEFLLWLDAQVRVDLVSLRVRFDYARVDVLYLKNNIFIIFDEFFRGLVEYF